MKITKNEIYSILNLFSERMCFCYRRSVEKNWNVPENLHETSLSVESFSNLFWEALCEPDFDFEKIKVQLDAEIDCHRFYQRYTGYSFYAACAHLMGPRDSFQNLSDEARKNFFIIYGSDGLEKLAEVHDANVSKEMARQREMKANKDRIRFERAKKGGKSITGPHSIGHGTRRRIYQMDNFECVYCGVRVVGDEDKEGRRQSLDHLIPGIKKTQNLVTACSSCNSSKSNRTPEQAVMIPVFGRFRAKGYDQKVFFNTVVQKELAK